MTLHLLDVASYQGDLTADQVRAAGFGAVNLKLSHGIGTKSVHPDLARWVTSARAAGLGISTFHYLTADAPGTDQAVYAYRRISALGLAVGTVHQLDVECSPAPTLASVRGYLDTMTNLLGRPVALYTGDWWWRARAGWDVHDLSPYLWAAPNEGYLPGYPGDNSPRWTAGYGGWSALSVMQYAVGPLPGGTIDVSKSAIRDPAVWRDLTLGRPGLSYAPDTLEAARRLYINTLATAGYRIDPLAVGITGDDSHGKVGTSYHLGKDALKATAYSIVESSRDRNGLTNAAMALDLGKFSISVKGKAHTLRTFSVWLVAQCKAGTADTADIREVIYSPDGQVVKRWDRLGVRSTGDASHTGHTHISYFRDSENRSKTPLLTRYFTEIGVLEDEDMPTAKDVAAELVKLMPKPLTADDIEDVVDAIFAHESVDRADTGTPKRALSLDTWLQYTDARRNSVLAAVAKLQATADAILKNVVEDDQEYAKLVGEIGRQAERTIAALTAPAAKTP